ncbi:MAG: ABC transporter substrate-binding protein [Desulfuromonadaceae bacterium]|nr:ABC transporter substrate-binding protein [Desulfuromonadaceae bacterium]
MLLLRVTYMALISMFVAVQAFASVTDEVKKTVDQVVKIVSNKEMKKDEVKRRQALKQAISVIFDYSEMAKRSLGRHWNDRTPAERKQFVDLFATLLENSYASKIESYDNEKINYINETVDGDYAEVRSRIVTPSFDTYSLDYRLLNENGKWMIYDVIIEGVSLVSNYRSQFNRIISDHGYGELLNKLQTRSEEIKAQ